MPLAGVEKLVAFMKDFQARHAWFILKIVAPFSFFGVFVTFVVEGGWVGLAGSFEFWLYCKKDEWWNWCWCPAREVYYSGLGVFRWPCHAICKFISVWQLWFGDCQIGYMDI